MAFKNIFKRTKKTEERYYTEQQIYEGLTLGTLNFTSFNNYTESKSMKLSAVYRAVNVISDSVAMLPIDVFEFKNNWKYKQFNDLYHLLNVQPNKLMSAYTFKKQIIQYMLLKGNAYIYIIRDKQDKPIELKLFNPEYTKVFLTSGGEKVYQHQLDHTNPETTKIYTDDDIIHILNYSDNGLIGISTLSYAAMTL